MKKNIYYVYAYLDPTREGDFIYNDGEYKFQYEPFYIGKGSNGRDRTHIKRNGSHNKEFKDRINLIKENSNIDPIVIKLWENLSEEEAYGIEKKAIKTIRTLYNRNTGPLLNKTHSNVYDVHTPGNENLNTYILEHPYISVQEVNIGKNRFISFCKNLKLDYCSLLKGKTVDGWNLIIV